MSIRLFARILVAVAVLIMTGTAVSAQTTTVTIEGIITDTTGAVLQGAAVELQGEAMTRTVVSNEDGFYRAAGLPAGRYTVIANAAGFQPRRIEGFEVALNHTASLDVQLDVAVQDENVVVQATAGPDVTTSATSHVIGARQIEAMPLNGRNYLDLALLTPGVNVNTNARTEFGDRDTRGSILGERGGNTAFLIDGLENNDDFRGGVFQAYTQDAIQEFEVIGAGYKAEFGRGSGGVINAITKMGSNQMKGSAFLFIRNDSLDASNVKGDEAPDLSRFNSGATIGGPITEGRAWYFGSFERVFERREAIFPGNVPAVLSLNEDFSKRPETRSDRIFGKYTRTMSSGHDLRAEGSWSRLENINKLATAQSLPSASDNSDTKTFLGSVAYTSVVNSNLMLESSIGYRDQRYGVNADLGDGFSYTILFRDTGGSFDFGPNYANKETLDQKYWTVRETASLFTPLHTAKAGLEYVHTSVDGVNGQGLLNFIVTNTTNFARFGTESFQIPQGTGFINPGDERSRMRNNGVSLFLQDDWRVVPNVTLNLGVRYDYDSKFDDGNNVAPRVGLVWALDKKTVLRGSWGLFYDRYRLGIAQSIPELGGYAGKTVVEMDYPRLMIDALNRSGGLGRLAVNTGDPLLLHKQFGIPENVVVTRSNIQSLTGLTPEQFVSAVNAFVATFGNFTKVDFSPSTGYLRQDLGASFQDRVDAARPFKTPFNNTFSVGGQRTAFADVSVGATYLHRRVRNISGVKLTNLSPQSRVTGVTATTDGAPLARTYGPWYDGTYDAMILSLEKPFNGRYQFQVNYTYARGTDNLANANLAMGVGAQGGGAVPTDNLNLDFDRGNSDFLVPHTVVASGVVALPADFSLSGIWRASSGPFFTASGDPKDFDGDGLSSTRPEGTKRNEFRGPKSVNMDVRVEKRFTIDRYTVSGLIEFFNLFNARNPGLIDTSYVTGAPSATFGTVRVPQPGREAQIGLKLLW